METFAETHKLIIKQKFEPLEAMANAAANALDLDMLGGLGETANKYEVFTNDGGDKFRVIETSELCGCTGKYPGADAHLCFYSGDDEGDTEKTND